MPARSAVRRRSWRSLHCGTAPVAGFMMTSVRFDLDMSSVGGSGVLECFLVVKLGTEDLVRQLVGKPGRRGGEDNTQDASNDLPGHSSTFLCSHHPRSGHTGTGQ